MKCAKRYQSIGRTGEQLARLWFRSSFGAEALSRTRTPRRAFGRARKVAGRAIDWLLGPEGAGQVDDRARYHAVLYIRLLLAASII